MISYRFLISLLLSLIAGLLVSCIEGREEVWINANGSGRAEISYEIPTAATRLQGGVEGVREKLETLVKDSPELNASYSLVETGDRLRVTVNASFASAPDLAKAARAKNRENLPAASRYLTGEFAFNREGRTIDIARTISAGKAIPGARFIPERQLRDRKLIYIIHLPAAAEESNATSISENGRTLTWEYPLSDALRGPVTTHFKVKIPIPVWLWVAGISVVLFIAALIVFLIRRFRNRSNPPLKIC